MKQNMRRYEDDAEDAAEKLKKLESDLKAKYRQAKNLKEGDKKIDDKKGGDFIAALKNAKDTTFSEEVRKQWKAATELSKRLGETAARYRPMAYAVSDVAPPQVPELASTYVLAGGE